MGRRIALAFVLLLWSRPDAPAPRARAFEVETARLARRAVRSIAPFLDESEAREETQNRRQRIYANATKLSHFVLPTTKDELFTPAATDAVDRHTAWISSPFRAGVVATAFAAYPGVIRFAHRSEYTLNTRDLLTETMRDDAAPLTSSFAPAVSLLYGAWLSITFSILEDRIGSLQRTATEESALLTALCRRTALLVQQAGLVSEDDVLAHRGCCCDTGEDEETAKRRRKAAAAVECVFAPIFEQTTTMATRSREEEILLVANDDVYRRYEAALSSLVSNAACLSSSSSFSKDDQGAFEKSSAEGKRHAASLRETRLWTQVDSISVLVDRLVTIRAVRLSKETRALPPAHFVILSTFSLQLLLCFIYAVAASPTPVDDPVLRVAFAFFFSVYLLVFNFALDLNDPFRGNYQIRRSAINANLLATRRLVAAVVGDDVALSWERDLL